MKLCENCKKEHDGSYGSGRFCSSKCARGFSTKEKRSLINEKVGKKLKLEPYLKICPFCEKTFFTKRKHVKYCSNLCGNRSHGELSREIAKKYFIGNRNSYAYGWYDSPIAGKVFLESSYEVKVAKELDSNKIKWERPKFIFWNDKKNRYFPDFYLNDFNVYLDPKNDFLISRDFKKIKKVEIENNVKIIILDKHSLTWESIKQKIALLCNGSI